MGRRLSSGFGTGEGSIEREEEEARRGRWGGGVGGGGEGGGGGGGGGEEDTCSRQKKRQVQLIARVNNMTDMRAYIFTNKQEFFKEGEVEEREKKVQKKEADLRSKVSQKKRQAS